MEADTGIWGAIVGGGLGIIGALVGIYCATRGVVNMIFSDESLALEQRRDRIINYANFTFITTNKVSPRQISCNISAVAPLASVNTQVTDNKSSSTAGAL